MLLRQPPTRRTPPPAGWPRPARVQVWSSRVDSPAGPGQLEVLAPEERARADRLRFERDRVRFVARRVFLRTVLGHYLDIAPAAIRYRRSPLGRPELDPDRGLTFSTSHADGLAIVAVASGQPVGVDVEHVRPIPDALELAARFFSAREYELLASLAEPARSMVFLGLWTRKEAYVKAVGAGMSRPFGDVEVLDARGWLARRLRTPADDGPFALAGLDGLPGYVGVVAARGSHVVLEHEHVRAVA